MLNTIWALGGLAIALFVVWKALAEFVDNRIERALRNERRNKQIAEFRAYEVEELLKIRPVPGENLDDYNKRRAEREAQLRSERAEFIDLLDGRWQ